MESASFLCPKCRMVFASPPDLTAHSCIGYPVNFTSNLGMIPRAPNSHPVNHNIWPSQAAMFFPPQQTLNFTAQNLYQSAGIP